EGKSNATPKEPTKPRNKPSKKKQVPRDESPEFEGELKNTQVSRKIRTSRAVVIQKPPSVPVKRTQKSSGKLKGIKMLSEATQLELVTQKAIKDSRRASRPKNKNGSSSEGTGVSPGVSTDEETNKDDDEDDANEEEEDEEESFSKEAENKEEKDDTKGDDQKTEEEPKGDDQAKVGVLDLVTSEEKSKFLQSTSSHSISLNFGNQFLVKSPNASLIGTIPKNTDKEITSLMDIKIQQDVPLGVQELKQVDPSTAILESIRSQVPSMKSEYKEFIKDSVTNEVKKQLSKILPKAVSDFVTLMIQESLTEFKLKKILMEKIKKSQSYQTADAHKILYDVLVKSYLLDKDLFESYGQTVVQYSPLGWIMVENLIMKCSSEIIMTPGFIDFEKPNHVYKFKKDLNDLEQDPKAWYDRLKAFLVKHEYNMGMVDNTLLTKKKGLNLIIVQIYVNDIIFGSTCQELYVDFAKIMHDEFEMSMMGELNFIIGLQTT
ncbi:copia protein, partial [Tanacetum coccineum]